MWRAFVFLDPHCVVAAPQHKVEIVCDPDICQIDIWMRDDFATANGLMSVNRGAGPGVYVQAK
jgi:hypothetical protein